MAEVASRPASASRSTVARLMLPTDANFMGNVFGGVLLAEVDRVAYVSATRHSRRNCVTASFDRVDFLKPIHVGAVVEFRSRVTFVGRSSMEVAVDVNAEELAGGGRERVGRAYVTMVATDASGRPAEVPRLELATDEERREFEEGRLRMETRRAGRPLPAG